MSKTGTIFWLARKCQELEKKLSAQYAAHQSVKRAHERLVAENG